MTLHELLDRYYQYLTDPRRRSSGIDEAIATTYLNAAYEDLINEVEVGFPSYYSKNDTSFTPTSGAEDWETALPADFRAPLALFRTGGSSDPTRLIQVSYEKRVNFGTWNFLRDIYGTIEDFWYLRSGNLGITKVGGSYGLSFAYSYQPAKLADNDDTPEIPVGYHDLIARLAQVRTIEDGNANAGALSGSVVQRVEAEKVKLRKHVARRMAVEPGPEE